MHQAERARSGHVFYRPRMTGVWRPEWAHITLKAPGSLEGLVGQTVLGYINIERGYLDRATGALPRVHIRLERIRDGRKVPATARRLRLKIDRLETGASPPKVWFAEDFP